MIFENYVRLTNKDRLLKKIYKKIIQFRINHSTFNFYLNILLLIICISFLSSFFLFFFFLL